VSTNRSAFSLKPRKRHIVFTPNDSEFFDDIIAAARILDREGDLDFKLFDDNSFNSTLTPPVGDNRQESLGYGRTEYHAFILESILLGAWERFFERQNKLQEGSVVDFRSPFFPNDVPLEKESLEIEIDLPGFEDNLPELE